MSWDKDISPEAGPYKVLMKRGVLYDAARDGREVPIKFYGPLDHDLESYPLVVWSHGFGGNADGAGFISRYLASHGYGLLHLTHRGTDSSLWEGKPGHPWDILKQVKIPRTTTFDRMKDVPFVLDQFPEWIAEHPDVAPYIDYSKIGMSGHSFGAMTTQVMGGMPLPDREGNLIGMRDSRFRAGILYSPVPIAHLSNLSPGELYGRIDMPLFHMTGTDDASPLEPPPLHSHNPPSARARITITARNFFIGLSVRAAAGRPFYAMPRQGGEAAPQNRAKRRRNLGPSHRIRLKIRLRRTI